MKDFTTYFTNPFSDPRISRERKQLSVAEGSSWHALV